MKNNYLLLIIVLATSLQAQWSTDPNNNLVIGVGWDPHIVSDSAGGCYITYNYGSFYPQKLAVERLDKYGFKPWGDKKQILGELPEQWQAEIIEDGEGGVIISYEDNQVVGTDFTVRMRVQKVDSNGNFLWGQTGVRVSTQETNHGTGGFVSDGDGGCVIVWQDYSGQIFMNRIDRFGLRVWSETGIFIINTGTSINIVRASDGNYYVKINTNMYRINQNGQIINQYSSILGQPVPDPEGGVVLSGKTGTINNIILVSQRKDSLGNNIWQEPYVEIADSLGLGSFRIGVNNRIINYAWLGTYNGQTDRPCFQAVNLEGNLVYQNNILLSENPSGTTFIGIISSYLSNTIFSWSIPGEINSIFAQMYDTLGNKKWSENGIIVSHPRMTYQQYITDGRGGFIVAGLINNFTVVAQQVSKNGYLGEIVTLVNQESTEIVPLEITLYQNYPNPFNSNTVIKFFIPSEGQVRIELYNVIGELIKTIADGFFNSGIHTVNLSSGDLPSGIYLYKMEIGTQSFTKKLIIMK